MRTILSSCTFLTIFFFSSLSYADNEKTLSSSEIAGVKIFLNGAQVSRVVHTNLEPGITRLTVDNLSPYVDKNRVQVTGTGDFTIVSVEHELNYLKQQQKTPEIIQLEDSLEKLNFQLSQVRNMRSVYDDEQSMILANKSVGGQNNGVTIGNLKEVADFYRSRLENIYNKQLENSIAEKKLTDKIALLNQQLNTLNTKKNQPTSNIIVTVSAKGSTTAKLNVTYYVSGASWSPVYDIRVKDISGPVQLSYKANVTQNTGEEWKNVKLKLSTGNPSLSGSKPNLEPWHLYLYDHTPQRKYRMKAAYDASPVVPTAMDRMEKSSVRGNIESLASTSASYTEVNESQLAVEFDIQIPYSIASNGKQCTVDVQNYSLASTYSYTSAPKLDKDAFLLARITGWEEYNLLPGPASVYFEGGYIGQSTIDPGSTSDTLDLGLGRDKKVVIVREKLKDHSTNQFLGGNIVKAFAYETSIRNTKKDTLTIVIEDQLPISENKDIEVKAIETSSAIFDEKTGKLTWKITLAPAETKKIKLSYTVKYPKDKVTNL